MEACCVQAASCCSSRHQLQGHLGIQCGYIRQAFYGLSFQIPSFSTWKIQKFCFEQEELAATTTVIGKLSLRVISFSVAAWADMFVSELLFKGGA